MSELIREWIKKHKAAIDSESGERVYTIPESELNCNEIERGGKMDNKELKWCPAHGYPLPCYKCGTPKGSKPIAETISGGKLYDRHRAEATRRDSKVM